MGLEIMLACGWVIFNLAIAILICSAMPNYVLQTQFHDPVIE